MCSDALQTLLVHQLSCSWNLRDEKVVRKPDDVCGQCDGWDLEDGADTQTNNQCGTFFEKPRGKTMLQIF